MAKSKNQKPAQEVDVLELAYTLAELPSAQHRSGLAGLVLIVRWLNRDRAFREDPDIICEFTDLDSLGGTLHINKAGLQALFDEIYAASEEEQRRPQPFKDKQKNIVPPLREEDEEEVDPKTGKTKTKHYYIYPVIVPKGSFLADETFDSSSGHWVKLWRDMIWSILRGVPATRNPFEERARGNYSKDVESAWKSLLQPEDFTVDLPSTYYLGAQAANAENVPFKDKARFQFLLHFWVFASQIYVPEVVDNEGKRLFVGYAIAIPDVADLETFCDEYLEILRQRTGQLAGYRPRECVVDLAIEGALDMMRRMKERIALRVGEQSTQDLILGVEVIHAEKEGNNVRLRGVSRLDPNREMVDKYSLIRDTLRNPVFRKQQLLNLVADKPWFSGFDSLMCSNPWEHTFGDTWFRHDARKSFNTLMEVDSMEDSVSTDSQSKSLEAIVFGLVKTYVLQKLDRKHQLKWKDVEGNSGKEEDYRKYKEKVARSAFLDVRSRTEKTDFINYFVSSLCSVPHRLSMADYSSLTQALYEDTEKVRTLTLLALSANS